MGPFTALCVPPSPSMGSREEHRMRRLTTFFVQLSSAQSVRVAPRRAWFTIPRLPPIDRTVASLTTTLTPCWAPRVPASPRKTSKSRPTPRGAARLVPSRLSRRSFDTQTSTPPRGGGRLSLRKGGRHSLSLPSEAPGHRRKEEKLLSHRATEHLYPGHSPH